MPHSTAAARKAYAKAYYRKRKAEGSWVTTTIEQRREALLRHNYGITTETYEKVLDYQDGGCGICGQGQAIVDNPKWSLVVDHDHSTKEIRGLLCVKCNTGIGMFKDNISLLASAIRYLANPPPPVERIITPYYRNNHTKLQEK